MAPFANLFHPSHPPGTPQPFQPVPNSLHQTQSLPAPGTAHRPLRFLGQLIDEPYRAAPSHRARSRHREVFAPDFDVRETEGAYFLEGEFPGIRDKGAIKLEWVDRRTLAIDARVGRTALVSEWGPLMNEGRTRERCKEGCGSEGCGKGRCEKDVQDQEMDEVRDGVNMETNGEVDGGPCVREAELERMKSEEMARQREREKMGQGRQWPVREWLAERRVGHYQRTFTFPADVDAVGVRARLGQGLLRILVPKVREVPTKKVVDVENVE